MAPSREIRTCDLPRAMTTSSSSLSEGSGGHALDFGAIPQTMQQAANTRGVGESYIVGLRFTRETLGEFGHGYKMLGQRLPLRAVTVVADAMRVIGHARTFSAPRLLASYTELPPRTSGARQIALCIPMFRSECKHF